MADRSPYQQKLIRRYYDRRDEILLTRLGELIGELYLVASDRKIDQLWKRVEKALAGLKIADSVRDHLVSTRNVEALARYVRAWLDEAKSDRRP